MREDADQTVASAYRNQPPGGSLELRLEPLKRVEIELSVTPLVEGRPSRAQVMNRTITCGSGALISLAGRIAPPVFQN